MLSMKTLLLRSQNLVPCKILQETTRKRPGTKLDFCTRFCTFWYKEKRKKATISENATFKAYDRKPNKYGHFTSNRVKS